MSDAAESAWDAVIVGGGFFGLYLAEHLARRFRRVLVCEREAELMQRASYANQARVHNGYHYPRSLLTAFRSHVNYPRFVAEFPECLDRSFTQLYAIGRTFSKVSAGQFRTFCERIGSPIRPAAPEIKKLFHPQYIEGVFECEECAFDSVKLKEVMRARVLAAGARIRLRTEVTAMTPEPDGRVKVAVECQGAREELSAGHVFQCTYGAINRLTVASGLPPVALKYELTEMALVEVPDALRHVGITVMCGPFFSVMPFPPRGLHSFSHVRYTPHCHWTDAPGQPDALTVFERARKETHYPHMFRDARRYMPILSDCIYRDSIWAIKTVLPLSEIDDSRPILFKPHYGLRNHHIVMGGKIDNVYDALIEIDRLWVGEKLDV